MKLVIRAYDENDQVIPGHGFKWTGLRYRSTSWYRQLPWCYTIANVAYFLIYKNNKVLERVEHNLPSDI